MNIDKTPAKRVFEEMAEIFSRELQKNIRLTEIDEVALNAWEQDWKPINQREPPNGGWNWKDFQANNDKKFKTRYFNMAIWEREQLCGLSLGHISRDSTHVWIDLIEGSPFESHPLKGYILKIIIVTSTEYARVMKRKFLKLAEPVSGLIEKYTQQYGFEYVNRGFFKKRPICQKEV
ncbi:MAG: hypothetical protein J7647_24500 [Cyanobacteria bacterium SBLK]|nr:hypothetical protein [Cyanobacteria bacterium SBLK]